MQPNFGKRQWIKLWTTEWLDGTTRYEIGAAQRAFWIDLLAMAGRSRYPGVVCSGKNGDDFVGYPIKTFEALLPLDDLDIAATLTIFETSKKVRIELSATEPTKLYVIHILNWDRYQSNLVAQRERTRRHRKNKKKQESRQESRDGHNKSHVSVTAVEGEGEGEGEENHHPVIAQSGTKNGAVTPTADDLKKRVLARCEDTETGQLSHALDIIIERAHASGVEIRTEKYLETALQNFDFEAGPDHEAVLQRIRKRSM